MEFETKVLSKSIQEMLYNSGCSVATAESCTGGRIAESLIAIPGASKYFKGGIVSYADEVKINLLGVSESIIAEKSAVCEEVARQMVSGVMDALRTDFAISVTGFAGPSGGAPGVSVGTIWIGYGCKDDIRAIKLSEDHGRDINLSIATKTALRLFCDFLREHEEMLKQPE